MPRDVNVAQIRGMLPRQLVPMHSPSVWVLPNVPTRIDVAVPPECFCFRGIQIPEGFTVGLKVKCIRFNSGKQDGKVGLIVDSDFSLMPLERDAIHMTRPESAYFTEVAVSPGDYVTLEFHTVREVPRDHPGWIACGFFFSKARGPIQFAPTMPTMRR